MLDLKETKDGVRLNIRVLPRSSRNELAGHMDGALKVRLTAPPVEGAANKALVKLLSSLLRIPKSSIEIVSGETSRNKTVLLSGLSLKDVNAVL